jgi:hypothetical protein
MVRMAPPAPAPPGLWHVTLTMGGDPVEPDEVLAALTRLSDERPFLLTGRYGAHRAEIAYWEEAANLDDAAALALRLWGEHRASAELPPWQVLGLEIVGESIHRERSGGLRPVSAVGAWRRF